MLHRWFDENFREEGLSNIVPGLCTGTDPAGVVAMVLYDQRTSKRPRGSDADIMEC